MIAPFFSAKTVSPKAEALCGAFMAEQAKREGHKPRHLDPTPAERNQDRLDRLVDAIVTRGLSQREAAAETSIPLMTVQRMCKAHGIRRAT